MKKHKTTTVGGHKAPDGSVSKLVKDSSGGKIYRDLRLGIIPDRLSMTPNPRLIKIIKTQAEIIRSLSMDDQVEALNESEKELAQANNESDQLKQANAHLKRKLNIIKDQMRFLKEELVKNDKYAIRLKDENSTMKLKIAMSK